MKTLKNIFLLLTVAVLLVGCMSDEKKIEKYKKAADEFVSNYEANNIGTVLAKVIDLNTQKIFYRDNGKALMVYDLSTKQVEELYPENGRIDGVDFSKNWKNKKYTSWDNVSNHSIQKNYDAKPYVDTGSLYNERLFLYGYSNDGDTWIFYVNTKDNSFHLVAKGGDLGGFIEDDKITLYRTVYYDGEQGSIDDAVSMVLSDEEYRAERTRQIREEERFREEIRKRPTEKRIYISFDYDRTYPNAHRIICEGIEDLRRLDNPFDSPKFGTGDITVPEGKIWISKKLRRQNLMEFYIVQNNRWRKYEGETITLNGGQSFTMVFDGWMEGRQCELEVVFTEINAY